jgi:hypothetical protein
MTMLTDMTTLAIALAPREIEALLQVYYLADPKDDGDAVRRVGGSLVTKQLITRQYNGSGKSEQLGGWQYVLTPFGAAFVAHLLKPVIVRCVVDSEGGVNQLPQLI